MRYLIWTPPPINASASNRISHRLCHFLNVLGEQAHVTGERVHEQWNTPRSHEVTPTTVVVYPDSVAGNPLKGTRVVRYCTNRPGLLGGDATFASGDMVFYYDDHYFESVHAATTDAGFSKERAIKISIIEPELFYNDKSIRRACDCLYVGKAALSPKYRKLADESGYVPVTAAFPSSRRGLANLFRECRTFVSYDDTTMLLAEAQVCGADVAILDQETGKLVPYAGDTSNYVAEYFDTSPVERFIRMTRERWN